MNTQFISSIHGLEMDPIQIQLTRYNLSISKDQKIINDFYIEEVKRIVGSAQYENAVNRKTFIYTEFESPKDFNSKQVLAYLINTSRYLANALWLIKDNPVSL